ncbi:MAG: lysine--tRNA ligase [Patescibacteria group bacterium]|nr:lysine--tRNA ligase [Patescibacteria group bacterium]
MFWADKIALDIKEKRKGPQWVDDMKTPSGKIHVGALRGVILHDLIYKALLEAGVESKSTYIINDYDPMDDLPSYLPPEYEKYMGMPFFKVPAPDGSNQTYAQYYAHDFISVFNKLGAEPEIFWDSKLYPRGIMDEAIRIALDSAEKIQDIYQEVSGSKKRQLGWLPFQPICPKCGKIGSTRAFSWDGEIVEFICEPEMVKWAKGCGYLGRVSPFGGTGKLPWKVEWPAHWMALGITVEGAGKDHSSAGGSRDIANSLCREVFKIEPAYNIPYEWFLVGGAKMSSSKGTGVSAEEVAKILPPEVLRFLLTRFNYKQTINFDPAGETIPKLFDEYDRAASAYFEKTDEDLARAFELSQIKDKPREYFRIRFSQVANWVQMPNVDPEKEAEAFKGSALIDLDHKDLQERIKYVKIWLENYAPEEAKFTVHKTLPLTIGELNSAQKELLAKIAHELGRDWQPEELQNAIYNWGKDLNLTSSESFQAIYLTLLAKKHGPKASWLILSLDKNFVKDRFIEANQP